MNSGPRCYDNTSLNVDKVDGDMNLQKGKKFRIGNGNHVDMTRTSNVEYSGTLKTSVSDMSNLSPRVKRVRLTLSNFHPPAVAIEAIRDFAESVHTPIFQAYMTRYATATERRVHAIYAQLGVSFIQCPDLGKDTADKKIISDMWKFYADKSQSKSRIRIVLITGDRDFADTIGQLRNVGVEIGILTGSSVA